MRKVPEVEATFVVQVRGVNGSWVGWTRGSLGGKGLVAVQAGGWGGKVVGGMRGWWVGRKSGVGLWWAGGWVGCKNGWNGGEWGM